MLQWRYSGFGCRNVYALWYLQKIFRRKGFSGIITKYKTVTYRLNLLKSFLFYVPECFVFNRLHPIRIALQRFAISWYPNINMASVLCITVWTWTYTILSCTCAITEDKLHWMHRCLLYTFTDQNNGFFWYYCHMLPVELWEHSCESS